MTGIFAFVLIYPLFRDAYLDMFGSKGIAEMMAFSMSIISIIYVVHVMYIQTLFFISVLLIFMSMFSGFELAFSPKYFKINFALFMILATLPIWKRLVWFFVGEVILKQFLTTQGGISIIYLVKGTIYLIGVGKGVKKHIYPMFNEMYAKLGCQTCGGVLAVLFMIICAVTIALSWFGVEVPFFGMTSDFSDAAFIIAGLIGLIPRLMYLYCDKN